MPEWFHETLHTGYAQAFEIRDLLFESKTGHQHLVIFDSPAFGRVMALDGIVQTTEADEFIYHEMLAHVPMFAHGRAADVLIIGGGDGGLLREVLKHPDVEQAVQVEIDQAVIDMCIQYLPRHSAGAFDDPRTEIVIDDGLEYVKNTGRQFDVILSDSTDPVGPGEALFTSPFYQGIRRCLKPGGIFAAQNGVAFLQPQEVVGTHRRLSPLFTDNHFFSASVPTYIGGVMTFAWATDEPAHRQTDQETLEQRFKNSGVETRYYNPEMHAGCFAIPQYLKNLFEE